MGKYKVYYEGFYVIEADTEDEALDTSRDEYDVIFEEWQNLKAEELESE